MPPRSEMRPFVSVSLLRLGRSARLAGLRLHPVKVDCSFLGCP